jgi:hypothetical protein
MKDLAQERNMMEFWGQCLREAMELFNRTGIGSEAKIPGLYMGWLFFGGLLEQRTINAL